MKIIIASDIHGDIGGANFVIDTFKKEKADKILLLGDVLYHGPRNNLPDGYAPKEVIALLNKYKDVITCVRGNCDAEVDQMVLEFPIMADYALIVDQGKRLFLTHGHVYNESNLPNLAIDAFFYGHTHMQKLEKTSNGQIICNTGSVTFPKGGNPKTFAIYENGKVTMCKL